MSIDGIIIWIMMIFMAIAAFDRVLDQFGGAESVLGKIGLNAVGRSFEGAGKQFEEGFMAMGALGLAMVGMMAFAPVLASLLQGVLAPIYNALGANPAMFAGTVLAIDMGAYPLAAKLSNGDLAASMYSGILLASMMGATIVFSIPVGLGIIRKQDHRFLATGILAGMVAVPLGCIVGGLTAMAMGVSINGELVDFSLTMLLKNMIPVFLFAILIVIGLKIAQEGMIKGFQIFAKCLVALITIALAASVIEALTGTVIIPGMDPIFSHGEGGFTSAIETIGSIACVLLGAYPMVFLLTRWFEKPLMVFGRLLKMNESSVAGMIATLANNIPMFGLMSKMDDRGKVLNVAFSVCAAFALGDHLGFVAGVDAGAASAMITPMIVGKIGGGIIAIFIAMFFAPKATAGSTEEVIVAEEVEEVIITNSVVEE